MDVDELLCAKLVVVRGQLEEIRGKVLERDVGCSLEAAKEIDEAIDRLIEAARHVNGD